MMLQSVTVKSGALAGHILLLISIHLYYIIAIVLLYTVYSIGCTSSTFILLYVYTLLSVLIGPADGVLNTKDDNVMIA